jgi:hypothetical protein
MMTKASTTALLSLLAAYPLASAQAQSSAEGISARMTTFTPTAAQVLRTPPGLEGDFTVATEPPVIDFAMLPGQEPGRQLWSGWGDAVYASDDNFYGTIGDHDKIHGTSYVYRVDPRTGEIELVVDYNEHVDVERVEYAPGKIHAPLMFDETGGLYLIGYRGGDVGTTEENSYRGDWLLRFDVRSGEVQNLGIPVPYNSVASSWILGSGKVYGLNTPGLVPEAPPAGFFVYDLAKTTLLFLGGPQPVRSRAFMLAEDGRAWYSAPGGLVRYDPGTNGITPTEIRLPGGEVARRPARRRRNAAPAPAIGAGNGGVLRAASRPDDSGNIYGITQDGHVFSFDTRTEEVKSMGLAFVQENTATQARGGRIPLYTAVVRLSADGRFLYYVPSAHGGSSQHGTAVIQLDVTTGERKVLAFLNDYVEAQTGYNLGGTFGIALSDDDSQLFITWNGATDRSSRDWPDWGVASVMVLHIPESERN